MFCHNRIFCLDRMRCSDKIKLWYSVVTECTEYFYFYGGILMAKVKIFDAEMHLMNKIWDEGTIKAIELANWATENLGWKKNSTYSMLKKLIEKQAVRRDEPGFVITPLVSREEIAFEETNILIEKMFKGNVKMLLTSLISNQQLSAEDIEELKKIVGQSEDK